jgi:alpha-mannosidase
MMLIRSFLLCCLLAALCCSVVASDLGSVADTKLAELNSIVRPLPLSWRYNIGDIADAASPSLDDSAWQTNAGDSFQWGEQPLCWLRTKITVPDEVAGVKIAGSKITFTCGVDDDGVIFVDGKEAQKFHWDGGRVVLTDNAEPGQIFVIAIKGINAGGPGRLLSSNLEFSALSQLTGEVGKLLESYSRARTMYDLSDTTKREPYLAVMSKALEQVDTDAHAAGRDAEFIASVKSGEQQMNRVGELVRDITIDLVGHAHIDMNWLWLWPETLDVCKNTFTTMTQLMDHHPDFRFSQSQARTYLAMQETQPELFAKMKEKVKSGQWDVSTACAWVEGDLNMPSGEAIARSYLYGKRYIMKQFGIEPTVGWSPDTFGHAWTIPQIMAKCGIKYYYSCRTGPGYPLFWWQSPDGSRVLAYHSGSYGANVEENSLLSDAMEFTKSTGLMDYMHVYGVGDHGGGPTEAMLTTAKALQSSDTFPKIRFSSAADYFKTALKSKQDYPVWNNEMNFVFQGCYTSHSDIKRWNRECENTLTASETLAAIAANSKTAYPTKAFEDSWRKTCFNQFHDILDGTAIHGSYDFSRELHDSAIKQATSALDAALSTLIPSIKTTGKGVPIVVFNTLSWARNDVVIVPSPFTGGAEYAKVVDETGKAYPARVVGGKLCFTARGVPAVGYRVFWASRTSGPVAGSVKADGSTVENQFFRVQIDPTSGAIRSILDKSTGREVVANGGSASLLQILLEGTGGGNAWDIAAYTGSQDLDAASRVSLVENDSTKGVIVIEHSYDKSQFRQEITLYDGVPRIDIRLRADWQEVCENKPTPLLKLAFQTSVKNGKATFEIPFGSIERPTDGAEVPAQKWIDLSEPGYGVSLLNNCKYGFDVKDNVIRATVLRASKDPDPVPDKGIHEVIYSLYPHKGGWREAGTVHRGYELNEPLIARVTTPHSGALASARSYVSFSAPNLAMTAFKKAEDDNSLVLRFYETDGKPCKATVTVNLPARAVVETDILERPIGKPISLSNKQFTANVGKCEIKTYKLLR